MGKKLNKTAEVWVVPEFIERIHKSPYKLPRILDGRSVQLMLGCYAFVVAVKKIVQLARKIQPDVIYCNHMLSKPIGAVVGLILGVPVVFHARNISMTAIGKTFYTTLAQWTCVRRVIANSKATAIDFLKKTPWKVRVVHNFLNLDMFDHAAMPAMDVRVRYNIPPQATVGAFFGRLVKKKGVDVLIRACEIIMPELPTLYVLIVGGNDKGDIDYFGVYRERIRKANLQDRIILCGMQEDVRPFLSSSDFVVMPSTDPEPFGRVLIESMAFKIPAIATAHGGAVEVVEDEVTGLWVHPNDAFALAKAMERLCKDEEFRLSLGQAAYQRLKKNFCSEKLSSEITRIILEACDSKVYDTKIQSKSGVDR